MQMQVPHLFRKCNDVFKVSFKIFTMIIWSSYSIECLWRTFLELFCHISFKILTGILLWNWKVIEEANAGEIVAVFNAPGSYSCHSRRNVFRETAPMWNKCLYDNLFFCINYLIRLYWWVSKLYNDFHWCFWVGLKRFWRASK